MNSIEANVPLASLTTFGIGGPADALARPESPEEAAEIVRSATGEGKPLRVLGAGSNVLVSDEGVRGVVMLLSAAPFKSLSRAGGEMVHVGKEILPQLGRIPARQRRDWIVQRRVRPNVIEVDGILSRRRRVMADLGVFVHYDWDGERFLNFRVGGMITRATNRSRKVNVSGGGIQVPVMFDRAK